MTHRGELLPVHINMVAIADIERAIRFYNRLTSGLGRAFLHELHEQMGRVQQFPEAYPRVDSARRRATLARFPYAVVYEARPDRIDIVGVFDCRANPSTLADRS